MEINLIPNVSVFYSRPGNSRKVGRPVHEPVGLYPIQFDLKFRLVISCGFIPPEAKTFLKCTRDQVEHPKVIVTATSFTFGREDLLPHIFKQLIQQPLLKEILQNRILTKKNHTNDRSHF